MEWSLSGTLPASGCQGGREGQEEKRWGGKGSMVNGSGPGEGVRGDPFLEVREEHLEFKAEGAMPS